MVHVAGEGGATDSLEVVLQLKCCVVTVDNFGRFDVGLDSWLDLAFLGLILGSIIT